MNWRDKRDFDPRRAMERDRFGDAKEAPGKNECHGDSGNCHRDESNGTLSRGFKTILRRYAVDEQEVT